MSVTVARLQELLDPYSYNPVECDGLSWVLSTLLYKQGIAHSAFIGSVDCHIDGVDKVHPVHVWLKVDTGEGQYRIDYRAQQWLGPSDDVPHGIFDPRQFPQVCYEGVPMDMAPLDAEIFAVLATPVVKLLDGLRFLPKPLVFTVGYRQPDAESIITFLVSRGFLLVDIRERAGSRYRPTYNRSRLAQRFGQSYVRVRELGNVKHGKPSSPIEFRDLETGIERTRQLINSSCQGIVYMCACDDWKVCHRGQAAHHLLEVAPEVTVVHIQSNGSLVVKKARSRSEMLLVADEPLGPYGMLRVVCEGGQFASTYNPVLFEHWCSGIEGLCVMNHYCEIPPHQIVRENLERQGVPCSFPRVEEQV